jgi:hypothetical protein
MNDDIIDISMDFNNNDWGNSHTNFGGGIELLMNDKKTNSRNSDTNIDIDDLNNLENELNDLAAETSQSGHNAFESSLFGIKTHYDENPSVSFSEEPNIHILGEETDLGHSTANMSNDAKTWDGYGKFNNVPINPDVKMTSEPKLSKNEMLREKYKYFKKLEALENDEKVTLTKKYTMDSDLNEMIAEYEMIVEEKSKQNSIKFQANMLMALINGIEFLNARFDPFDVKLDGWGEQINENIGDFKGVFDKLHEKYNSKFSVAPELELMFKLAGSAMMVHMSNTIFKSAMPGMDDILRQNPDLMRQFQTAAVNSMAKENPGFSGFMNNIMTPPADSRPPQPTPFTTKQGPTMFAEDGISIKEKHNQIHLNGYEPPQNSQRSKRPDMNGPRGDISDILSGLKTKTIEVVTPSSKKDKNIVIEEFNNNSTISIDDLKSLQTEGNVPKRVRRKQKSDKNTVSLDI